MSEWDYERERRSREAAKLYRRGVMPFFGPPDPDVLWAPGRSSLEWSVALSAIAIVAPVCSLGAAGFAIRCRRAGGQRWRAALLAAVWCGLIGIAFRRVGGLGLIP
jgi:hypothetical protein